MHYVHIVVIIYNVCLVDFMLSQRKQKYVTALKINLNKSNGT